MDLGLKMDYTPVEYYAKALYPFCKHTHIAPWFLKKERKSMFSLCKYAPWCFKQ